MNFPKRQMKNIEKEDIQKPKELSLWWWYTSAWLSLTLGNFYLLFGANFNEMGLPFGFSLILVLINSILMVMILRESKYAFLISTIIGLNPLLWLVNGVYLYRRWNHPVLNKPNSPKSISNRKNDTEGDQLSNSRYSHYSRIEESAYEQAARELEKNEVRKGLWAKAFSEADGNEQVAGARYIKMRSEQIMNDLQRDSQISEKDALRSKKHEESVGQSDIVETAVDRQRAMDDLIKRMKATE